MTDLEKVITGLECCSVKQSCSECPWMGLDCNDRLHLAALELLKQPIELDGYRIKPPKVRLLHASGEKATVEVIIHEGRNRQVRRMCQAAGMNVARLVRVAEGKLRMGDLKSGAWRHLRSDEVEKLLSE